MPRLWCKLQWNDESKSTRTPLSSSKKCIRRFLLSVCDLYSLCDLCFVCDAFCWKSAVYTALEFAHPTLRCCFFVVVAAAVLYIFVSFSLRIVQIKSGVSLFVHLLFGCTMYIGLWFFILFSSSFFLLNHLWLCAPFFIVCGRTGYVFCIGCSLIVHMHCTQHETLNMPQTYNFFVEGKIGARCLWINVRFKVK